MASVRCHYEVLGVEQTASDDDLKRAYRRMARQLHPDKNRGNEEEATQQFQMVQAAYAVLSDPQERAWYDKHREAILQRARGGDGTEGVDVMPYFSTTAFHGYDDEPEGFYTVYRELFKRIVEDEQLVMKLSSDKQIPSFGDSASDVHKVVRPFYKHWDHFTTRRHFHSRDKWDLRDAPNRQVRRLMEKENKKLRASAKKEYVATIRQLVRFVKKRDKRYQRYLERLREERERAREEEQRREEEKAQRLAEEQARREERLAAQAEEVMAEREEDLSALDAYFDKMFGDDENEEDEEAPQRFECVVCNKVFKTSKQLANHERSKKHRQAMERLRQEMMAEDDADVEDMLGEEEQEEEQQQEQGGQEQWQELRSEQRGAVHDGEAHASSEEDSNNGVGEEEDSEDESVEMSSAQEPGEEEENSDEEHPTDVENGGRTQQTRRQQRDDTEVKTQSQQKGNHQQQHQQQQQQQQQQQKRRRRRRKQNKAEPAAQQQQEELSCNVCGQSFSSRNKLFQHINATGHALHPAHARQRKPGVPASKPKTDAAPTAQSERHSHTANNSSGGGRTNKGSKKKAARPPLIPNDDGADDDPWADAPRDKRRGRRNRRGKR